MDRVAGQIWAVDNCRLRRSRLAIGCIVVDMGRFLIEARQARPPQKASELERQGTSHHVLAGRRWQQTGRGFHRPAGLTEVTAAQRIIDVAATLPPGGLISGWAAAYALGADLLDGLDDFTHRPTPVTALLPPGVHRARAADVRYVQQWSRAARKQPLDPQVVASVPVTGPVRTAFDLTRSARDLVEAVVVLDAMVGARVVDLDSMLAALPAFRATRGIRQARTAVGLAAPGVLSTWESRLRMFWVLELGLPSPRVNVPVFDLSGRFLGSPDLLDDEAGLAMEYDGMRWRSATRTRGHRDEDQHRDDNVREERFERASLITVRCDKLDLTRYRSRLGRRLRDARADGLARDRHRDRWTLEPPPGWLGLPA